jgi:hypothetical protein
VLLYHEMRLWFNMIQAVQQVPYRAVPYRTVPYRAVPCRTVPYRTVPYRMYTELAGIRIFVTRLWLDEYLYIYMQVLEL